MFPGGLVGKLGEFADEFFEHRAHLRVADDFGVQVNVGEFLGDEIQQAGFGEFINLGVKLEALKDVTHGGGKCLEIRAQIFTDVVLITHELFQVEGRGVVKELAGFAQQERLGVDLGGGAFLQLREHGSFGAFQHAIQSAQDGERQDDLAIFRLFVIAAQEVGHGPDDGGKIGVAHAIGPVREFWRVVIGKDRKMRQFRQRGETKIFLAECHRARRHRTGVYFSCV